MKSSMKSSISLLVIVAAFLLVSALLLFVGTKEEYHSRKLRTTGLASSVIRGTRPRVPRVPPVSIPRPGMPPVSIPRPGIPAVSSIPRPPLAGSLINNGGGGPPPGMPIPAVAGSLTLPPIPVITRPPLPPIPVYTIPPIPDYTIPPIPDYTIRPLPDYTIPPIPPIPAPIPMPVVVTRPPTPIPVGLTKPPQMPFPPRPPLPPPIAPIAPITSPIASPISPIAFIAPISFPPIAEVASITLAPQMTRPPATPSSSSTTIIEEEESSTTTEGSTDGVTGVINIPGMTSIVIEEVIPSNVSDYSCFPGSTLVQVQNQGWVPLRSVQIGDVIATGSGTFEPIYSMAHNDPKGRAVMIQVETTSSTKQRRLQLTPSHLLFTSQKSYPIPASMLQVGDELVLTDKDSTIVTALSQSIVSDGLYAPLTPSGTFLVNGGIVVSSFVTLVPNQATVFPGISFHWASHAFEVPHRFVCHWRDCTQERYTDKGIPEQLSLPLTVAVWVLQLPGFVQCLIGIHVIGVLAGLWWMERFVVASSSPLLLVVVTVLVVVWKQSSRRKKKLL